MPRQKPATERLDQHLVKLGLLPDEKTAQGWIMSGAVTVNGQPVSKPGARVSSDDDIVVRGLDQKYASRGGLKLEAALCGFHLDVTGKVALDAGAAAGGFTDCLLQHGAALVYAVDVGYGQLRGSLAADPRVRNMERTNISDLRREDLVPPIDLCVADLSYLSLASAIPILKRLFVKPVVLVCLIKPLFEGVPQDRKNALPELSAALDRVSEAATASGLAIHDLIASPVLGTRGTVEFLGLFRDQCEAPPFDSLRDRALKSAP